MTGVLAQQLGSFLSFFFLVIIMYKYSTDYTLLSKTTRHTKVPPFSELHLSCIEDPKAAGGTRCSLHELLPLLSQSRIAIGGNSNLYRYWFCKSSLLGTRAELRGKKFPFQQGERGIPVVNELPVCLLYSVPVLQ